MTALKQLAKLRRYDGNNVENYLTTQMRQNYKAIEAAFDLLSSCSTRSYLRENIVLYPNNSSVKVPLNSVSFDTNSSYDLNTNAYVCKKSGAYSVSACIRLAGTNILANIYAIAIYKNGSLCSIGNLNNFTAVTGQSLVHTDLIPLVVGDNLELQLIGVGNNSVNGVSLITGEPVGSSTYFCVSWLGNI